MTTNPVDLFIAKHIEQFPQIFPDRISVLHHALCVIGNGMGWDENGNITSYNDAQPKWTREEGMHELEMLCGDNEVLHKIFTESFTEKFDIYEKRVDNALKLARKKLVPKTVYPQSDHALLMQIPDNVSPEWLEACEEMKAIAIEHGWKF